MALMRVLDLFSGIGGFSLGLERAGMQTVAFCEIEPYPRAVLRKHWPNVPCYEDVRTLTAERLNADGIGPIDVICGGFPCQPFSQAGKQLAEKDVRHLWPEYFRLVKECRPSWVIGENVIGLINLGLDAVLDDLEGIGYATRTFDIPACAVGAPHYRRRVWIIANATSGGRASGFNGDTKSTDVVSYSEDLAYSDCPLLQGGGGNNEEGRKESSRYARLACGEPESTWEIEPRMGRVANGVPSRVDRIKALGNAVVPQIPEIIGRAIMAMENK
jgi:DNA (cytosine-5)-methyltransferase 1